MARQNSIWGRCMYRSLNFGVGLLARGMAYTGGTVLLLLIALVCFSIIGRTLLPLGLGLGPIPGDVELLEMGMAFAIFAFLPWSQYSRGHARVDIFEPSFGRVLNRIIDILADGLMAAASILIAWRLWLGMLDKKAYMETTFILQAPIWYAYAAAVLGAFCFVLIAVFCVLRSLRALVGVSS